MYRYSTTIRNLGLDTEDSISIGEGEVFSREQLRAHVPFSLLEPGPPIGKEDGTVIGRITIPTD